jgi:hypothetical protein
MFNNTMNLTLAEVTPTTVSLVDGPTNRKTLRSSADDTIQLSIAHTESNENPGIVTSRSNIRISLTKEVEETGKTVTGYAQFTLSLPKTQFTVANARELACALMTVLISGENTEAEAPIVVPNSFVGVSRIYAGEP